MILNNIFDGGHFPEEWALGIIVILFKDGTKSELNNYRGITLLSMLGKILVGVLNNRLWEVVDRFDILRENQTGFRHGYRTLEYNIQVLTIEMTGRKPLCIRVQITAVTSAFYLMPVLCVLYSKTLKR